MHNSKVDLLQFTSYSDLHETQQKKSPHFLQLLAHEGSQVIEPRRNHNQGLFCTFLCLTLSGTLEF
jgi:hypothetical protein